VVTPTIEGLKKNNDTAEVPKKRGRPRKLSQTVTTTATIIRDLLVAEQTNPQPKPQGISKEECSMSGDQDTSTSNITGLLSNKHRTANKFNKNLKCKNNLQRNKLSIEETPSDPKPTTTVNTTPATMHTSQSPFNFNVPKANVPLQPSPLTLSNVNNIFVKSNTYVDMKKGIFSKIFFFPRFDFA
jgi:hypothetical protein